MTFASPLSDDEEPRPIGRAVNMRFLNRFVHLLFFFRQHDEVEFTGRSQ